MLSACANEVTVLIYGANVWRSAEVYLGGLRGKEIKVLPDMEGISASFNLVDFYKNRNSVSNPLGYEEVILRVNTRNGRDLQPIRIVGSRQPGDGKDKPADLRVALQRVEPDRPPSADLGTDDLRDGAVVDRTVHRHVADHADRAQPADQAAAGIGPAGTAGVPERARGQGHHRESDGGWRQAAGDLDHLRPGRHRPAT